MTGEKSDTRQRVFFGLGCPVLPGIRRLLEELQSSEASRSSCLRVVPEANLHLTLRYVGPVPEQQIEVLCAMAHDLVQQAAPFSFRLQGAGRFPNALWIGADVPSRAYSLAEGLDHRLVEAGFESDARPFRPHVTVARVKRRCGSFAEALCRRLADREFGQVPVDAVRLYRSEPGNGSSRYVVIREFPL